MSRLLGAVLGLLLAFGAQAQVDTLKKIRDSKSITLGFRTDSPPFSFAGSDGQPAGYSVELCKRVAAGIERQINAGSLQVKWLPVTAANRFDQVAGGAIDLECGNTTVTLGRQERVDFSNLTFVDGGAVVVLAESRLARLADLAGKTIAVKPGTTTEKSLKEVLKNKLIDAKIVLVKDEAEAFAALNDKKIDGYAADRVALVGNIVKAHGETRYGLIQENFSFEPYALMMRRDPSFRLAVNRALSQTYRSGAIVDIVNRWLTPLGKPGPLLEMMFILNTTPE